MTPFFNRLAIAGLATAAMVASASAQTARRDHIAELLAQTAPQPAKSLALEAQQPAPADANAVPAEPKDPREGDPAFEQARALMQAVDAILRDTADNRAEVKKLPGKDDFMVTPLWTETREDREVKVSALLDSALGIVTDVPIVEVQKKIEGFRRNIRGLEDTIAGLHEKQLLAPKDGVLPGMWTDTVASLGTAIEEANKRITENRDAITEISVRVADYT